VLAGVDNKPTELTLTALIRARFCELAAEQLGFIRPAEAFTLGLFSVIDGMLDAPMHDVAASLPLAEDMREALVQRRGRMGELLDCVTSLEVGEDGPATSLVEDAGDLYLEALMWANSAAESLFGEPGAAPGRASRERQSAGGRRAGRGATPTASTPPPAFGPAPATVHAGRAGEPGWFARTWARCRALFGRRLRSAT
jgi:hypothetical protein